MNKIKRDIIIVKFLLQGCERNRCYELPILTPAKIFVSFFQFMSCAAGKDLWEVSGHQRSCRQETVLAKTGRNGHSQGENSNKVSSNSFDLTLICLVWFFVLEIFVSTSITNCNKTLCSRGIIPRESYNINSKRTIKYWSYFGPFLYVSHLQCPSFNLLHFHFSSDFLLGLYICIYGNTSALWARIFLCLIRDHFWIQHSFLAELYSLFRLPPYPPVANTENRCSAQLALLYQFIVIWLIGTLHGIFISFQIPFPPTIRFLSVLYIFCNSSTSSAPSFHQPAPSSPLPNFRPSFYVMFPHI